MPVQALLRAQQQEQRTDWRGRRRTKRRQRRQTVNQYQLFELGSNQTRTWSRPTQTEPKTSNLRQSTRLRAPRERPKRQSRPLPRLVKSPRCPGQETSTRRYLHYPRGSPRRPR